jgi:hypothetical protein
LIEKKNFSHFSPGDFPWCLFWYAQETKYMVFHELNLWIKALGLISKSSPSTTGSVTLALINSTVIIQFIVQIHIFEMKGGAINNCLGSMSVNQHFPRKTNSYD